MNVLLNACSINMSVSEEGECGVGPILTVYIKVVYGFILSYLYMAYSLFNSPYSSPGSSTQKIR